jgi:hypothetical protein
MFPRVENVSWGVLNSATSQTDFVERFIIMCNKLLLPQYQPRQFLLPWYARRIRSSYSSLIQSRIIVSLIAKRQNERVNMLKELRSMYSLLFRHRHVLV